MREAERDRLTAHIKDLEGAAAKIDANAEVLGRLAELRASVAARVGKASGDLDALRAAWGSVFAHVWVMPNDDGGFRVVPVLRPEMVEGGWDDADGYVANEPPVRRVPLALETNRTPPRCSTR